MSKNLKSMLLFGAIMAMQEQDARNLGSPVLYEPKKAHDKPTPKGAKEYWFNDRGEFSSERMLKSDVVFSCIAINDKSAKKKFEKNRKQSGQPRG
jgi:hypothetical protein